MDATPETLRLRMNYVNLLISLIFKTMLHNQHLKGVGKDDEVTYISMLVELRRFFPVILIGGYFNFGQFRRADSSKTQLL